MVAQTPANVLQSSEMAQTLIVSSQPVLEGTALAAVLQGGVTSLEAISLVTNSNLLSAGALPSDRFSVAFSFAEDTGAHEGHLLSELYRSLKHSGTLTIVEKDHKVLDSNET